MVRTDVRHFAVEIVEKFENAECVEQQHRACTSHPFLDHGTFGSARLEQQPFALRRRIPRIDQMVGQEKRKC